ncbi:MAG TPA: SAM-dependent methyltransferase [Pyrinomonadaceae bacterium]|nr:SAM-dependent methyltransferase [Pyrinomonadaceae bacterium]
MSSPLAEELSGRIRRMGKITFREWMEAALYYPTFGYYNRTDLKRWGRAGDYRTSPERSELFAATFARHFVHLYEQLNQPEEFTIVEVGGGDGQFATGVLETIEKLSPAVFDVTRYVCVELSQDARSRTAERLQKFNGRVEFAKLTELALIEAGIVFSNELIDAFPVHRVTSVDGKLKELFVTVDDDGNFAWLAAELSTQKLHEFCRNEAPPLVEGQIIEVNLDIKDWLNTIAEKLVNGYLITVDYGSEAEELYDASARLKGTLRAFRRHKFVDEVLTSPGEYDITTSVDWTFVKNVGHRLGLEVERFQALDRFLIEAGALEELEDRLATAGSELEKSKLTTTAREMILPSGMAAHFQVLVQKRRTT